MKILINCPWGPLQNFPGTPGAPFRISPGTPGDPWDMAAEKNSSNNIHNLEDPLGCLENPLGCLEDPLDLGRTLVEKDSGSRTP